MKKKNGFTLVELLAVIVVLAIIMIIAIPSVLNSMNEAKKNSFILYFEKVYNAGVQKYMFDSNLGSLAGAGVYIYDITKDLDLPSTGDFKGYVVVDNRDVNNVQYYVSLYDNNFQILNHNVTSSNMAKKDDIETYAATTGTNYASTDGQCTQFKGVATGVTSCSAVSGA